MPETLFLHVGGALLASILTFIIGVPLAVMCGKIWNERDQNRFFDILRISFILLLATMSVLLLIAGWSSAVIALFLTLDLFKLLPLAAAFQLEILLPIGFGMPLAALFTAAAFIRGSRNAHERK